MVGMSKSGSRYGRRSNWFKIHCLLQEQTNNSQNAGSLGTSHFSPSFLPGFIPTLQSQSTQGLMYGTKDGRDLKSPSQEELALQSHILHVAMMKQKSRERNDKSPSSDDVALQNQLKLLAWQKQEERVSQQQPTTPPRNSTPPSSFPYKDLVSTSSVFSVNFSQKSSAIPSSSLEVFRPFLPIYKRTTDTPSDSSASSVESDEHDESRSNSAFSYFKQEAFPTMSERDFPRRKINATVTLTTDYLSHHGHNLIYTPTELVTPATSHHSLRGGDLLLASPSPGGIAVEQIEPIDLSIRSTMGFHRSCQSMEKKPQRDIENSSTNKVAMQETTTKINPLDLSIDVKRPAEVSL